MSAPFGSVAAVTAVVTVSLRPGKDITVCGLNPPPPMSTCSAPEATHFLYQGSVDIDPHPPSRPHPPRHHLFSIYSLQVWEKKTGTATAQVDEI